MTRDLNRFTRRRQAVAGWLAGIIAILAAALVEASVTIEFFFEDGTIPDGAIAILVADVNGDGFLAPTDPSAVGTELSKGMAIGGGDDLILAVLQADDGAHWNGSAGIAEIIEHLDYGTIGIAPGTPLIVYVFPEISQPGSSLFLGDAVTTYRNTASGGSGGTIPFVAPADPGVYTLAALTAAQGGNFDPQNPAPGEISEKASAGVPGSAGGGGGDDHGNSRSTATQTQSGQGIAGVLAPWDLDFFEVQLTGLSKVTIYTTGGTNTFGQLFGPGGAPANDPVADDDRGAEGNFRTETILAGPGTALLAVRGKNDSQAGNYEVFVEVESLEDHRPDGTIGKSMSSQRGDDHYNSSGAGQRLRRVSKNRRKVKFYFKVQNDGGLQDVVSVIGTPNDEEFRASYIRLSPGRANVTAAMKRTGYQALLEGLGEETFMLTVRPTWKAGRARKKFLIDARSAAGLRDRVRADVKAK